MKMKQKQDPPTCPCYATPRVYLDAYIVGARMSEEFLGHVPGTNVWQHVLTGHYFAR